MTGPSPETVAEAGTQVPGVTYLGRKSLDEILGSDGEAGVLFTRRNGPRRSVAAWSRRFPWHARPVLQRRRSFRARDGRRRRRPFRTRRCGRPAGRRDPAHGGQAALHGDAGGGAADLSRRLHASQEPGSPAPALDASPRGARQAGSAGAPLMQPKSVAQGLEVDQHPKPGSWGAAQVYPPIPLGSGLPTPGRADQEAEGDAVDAESGDQRVGQDQGTQTQAKKCPARCPGSAPASAGRE